MRGVFALALAIAGPAAASVQAPQVVSGAYAPRDECGAKPGASAFLSSFRDAVRRRDADALALLADPEIKLDFDDGEGPDELKRRLSGSEGEALWHSLADMLPLGCAVREGELVLPWFFAQDLPVDDAYGILLVTGERVPLLPKADAEARPVRLLSWTLVEPAEGYDESAELQPVRVVDGGLQGFVDAKRLRSPLDYRLIAARGENGWRITVLIAGD